MSVPVILGIVLNIQAALQGISKAAGYFYDVQPTSVVLDPTVLATVPETSLPFMIVVGDFKAQRNFSTSRPVAIKETIDLVLILRVDAPGFTMVEKFTAFAQITADVERALAADPQRGNLAMYTYVKEPTPYFGPPSNAMVFVEVPVEILLQRAYGAP